METNSHQPQPRPRAIAVAVCMAWLAHFLAAPAVLAQGSPQVRAAADPAEIKPGSFTTYTITVEGAQPNQAPLLQTPAGLEAAAGGPSYSNQTSIINGTVSYRSIFTWNLTARQPGTFVVPPQEIQIGGRIVKTNEVRIVANANAAQASSQYDPMLVVQVEKREVYIGEVVPITVTVYAPERRVAIQRIGLIEVPKDNFAIQRFPLQPEQTIVSMGGARYRAYVFRSTLSPLRPGKFKLGPATSEILFEVESRENNLSQHPFFTQREPHTAKPQSADIDMTVLPLPEEGRSPNFKGLVGDFEISLNADPRELSVGDPISVEMTISGSGNFDSLTAPALTSASEWKTYPARRLNMRQPDPSGETVEQRATFNQVIIPKKMVSEIPPFEISFFSPTKKQYITARTAPVPLNVKEAANLPASRPAPTVLATTGENAPTEPEKVAQPQVKLSDILTVLPDKVAWITPRPVLWQDPTFRLWNSAMAGVVVLLLGIKLGAWWWQSRAASASTPIREAWQQVRSPDLSRGAFYQAAAQYIRLRGGASNPELQKVLAQHEHINFSASSEAAAAPMPADERSRVLRALRS